MPGMTGMALHDHLTSRGLRVPTILITARPTSGERRRAIATGAASYLAKPLSEQILLDTVREALENGGPVGKTSPTGRGRPGIWIEPRQCGAGGGRGVCPPRVA